ncbi:MAG: L-threonylcarbamoyladenylate synthase [Myxococcota bacterium]
MIVAIERAASLLRRGDPVAFATETVYGLGVDALEPKALARLQALKGTSERRAYAVLVPDVATLEALAPEMSASAQRLARRFLPGPLTLVVEGYDVRLSGLASDQGVGFRCSSHPTAQALAARFGGPLVATSCNRAGEPPCGTAREVERVFGPDLAIAGSGDAGGAPVSTVIALGRKDPPRLLRPGAIPFSRILEEFEP